MSGLAEQFKININQNLWGLAVSFGALGAAENYDLCALFWLSVVASAIMVASIAVTTLAYTINYWKNKQKSWKSL
jgi:hypothetical protein